jgi:hypothetical protein
MISGCVSPVNATQYVVLEVDIQGGFSGQEVIILVNDIYSWEKINAQSDEVIEFVDSFKLKITRGVEVKITVSVDDDVFQKLIVASDNSYLGISRSKNGVIKFKLSDKPFLYD